MIIAINHIEWTEAIVRSSMFSGNNLFRHDLITGPQGNFGNALDLLNVSGLRYPGGTLTEVDFDVNNPDGPPLSDPSDSTYVGISDFLRFSESRGVAPTIVLPTSHAYLSNPDSFGGLPRSIQTAFIDDLLNFVRRLLTTGDTGPDALPDVPIEAFEIGNEYWGTGANMTAREYGQLVNFLIPKLTTIFNEVLGEDSDHPRILIQMGSPWDSQYSSGVYSNLTWAERLNQCNLDIISEITDPLAVEGISGLIEHYYYRMNTLLLGQNSEAKSYIDVDLSIWGAEGFSNLDLIITEWGVNQNNAAEFGLRGASVVIEQMEHMLKMGVDAAYIWGVQGWKTALAGSPGDTPTLSPMGAAFLAMAESIQGSTLLETGLHGGEVEVNAFGTDHKMVIFIMSRSVDSQIIEFDVSNIVESYRGLSGLKIGISDGVSTSDPWAEAVLTEYSRHDFGVGDLIGFELNSYEVMRLTFNLDVGKDVSGTLESERIEGGLGDDTLRGGGGHDTLIGGRGSDILVGSLGDDYLMGWKGGDTIRGHEGRDLARGQAGSDHIFGGGGGDAISGGRGVDVMSGDRGDDTLWGGQDSDLVQGGGGDDVLIGEAGGDYLDGALGSDHIFGGSGRNQLFGGSGADTLTSGVGTDQLCGGSGSDVFQFNSIENEDGFLDRICDFESSIDKILLSSHVFRDLQSVWNGQWFTSGEDNLFQSIGQRIGLEIDTGILWFDRDGCGKAYEPVAFCMVDLDEFPSANDFLIA